MSFKHFLHVVFMWNNISWDSLNEINIILLPFAQAPNRTGTYELFCAFSQSQTSQDLKINRRKQNDNMK